MKKEINGKSYERLTQEIYQAFVNYNNEDGKLGNIDVHHNITLTGKSGAKHQIDVYWEFECAGIKYKTIVEVKDWSTPVKKEQLLSFHGVLQDIPGNPNGIYVSKSGFQSGAKTYGKAHGIHLIQILKDLNKTTMCILLRFITTHYSNIGLWIDDNNIPQDADVETLKNYIANENWSEIVIHAPDDTKHLLSELIFNDAKPYYSDSEGKINNISTDLEKGWYWEVQGNVNENIPIVGYSFDCQNTWNEHILEIAIDSLADYLIKSILDEKDTYYNSNSKSILKFTKGDKIRINF